jgi:hypothetical protein
VRSRSLPIQFGERRIERPATQNSSLSRCDFSENNLCSFRVLLVLANLHLTHTQAADHQCSLNMAQRATTCTISICSIQNPYPANKGIVYHVFDHALQASPLVSFALQLIFIILTSPNNTASAANFSQCPYLGPEVVTCTSLSLQNAALASSVLKERRPLRWKQAHLEALEVYTQSRAV